VLRKDFGSHKLLANLCTPSITGSTECIRIAKPLLTNAVGPRSAYFNCSQHYSTRQKIHIAARKKEIKGQGQQVSNVDGEAVQELSLFLVLLFEGNNPHPSYGLVYPSYSNPLEFMKELKGHPSTTLSYGLHISTISVSDVFGVPVR